MTFPLSWIRSTNAETSPDGCGSKRANSPHCSPWRWKERELYGIRYAVTRLPDDVLPALQKSFADALASHDEHQRLSMMCQTRLCLDFIGAFPDSEEIKGMRFLKLFPQPLSIRLNSERIVLLTIAREAFASMDIDPREAKKAMNSYNERMCLIMRGKPLISILMPFVGLWTTNAKYKESRLVAIAGIAVERHRRAHGALSETLDALVPEFLDAVPVSFCDGKPLSYRTGVFGYVFWADIMDTASGYQVYGHDLANGRRRHYSHFTVSVEPPPDQADQTDPTNYTDHVDH